MIDHSIRAPVGLKCRACAGELGAPHSCRASLVHLGEQAHEHGQLEPVVELPLYDVTVALVIRTGAIELVVDRLELALLEFDDVSPPIAVTVAERG